MKKEGNREKDGIESDMEIAGVMER